MEKSRANKRKDKKEKSSQAIKIVIRHLPPTMTEEEFLEQVEPLPENDSYYYCGADWSLGQEATCRAYIDMSLKDISEVLEFRDRFDGYVFVDSKGVEYAAIVEYAPFQCFLKNKARNNDNKVNTIEKESHYQEFLQRLAAEREEASRSGDLKIDFTLDNRSDEKVKSTPLLQYLANKKEKRREEAKKRNEERRKQRDNQKQLAIAAGGDPAVASENKKGDESSGNNKKPQDKKEFDKEGQGNEKGKNSRSKRRTERDQRRREEHEQRKLAREREQRDKKTDQGEKSEKDNTNNSNRKKQFNQAKEHQKLGKDIVILKKEPVPTAEVDKLADVCTERLTIDDGGDKETKNRSSRKQTGQGAASQSAKQSGSSRSAEERRIRNKDRPSIAIYQPKVRMRLGSEENSSNDCKDSSNKPLETTEGDAALPDDKQKNNKRYGRRNKGKPQENPQKDNAEHTRCISKSSESSTSAHSITLK